MNSAYYCTNCLEATLATAFWDICDARRELMQSDTPEVSVIMPVYKDADYVGAAVSSVLNQSFRDVELVIINDATDDTPAILEYLAGDDDRWDHYFLSDYAVQKRAYIIL